MYSYETRKLNIQLVPKTAWYTNLRSVLLNWGSISAKVRSKGKCDICGKEFPVSQLDAHEVWEYDDKTHTQSLNNIICVCRDCHNAVHFGHAQVVGTDEEALEQYMAVNHLPLEEAEEDISEAFDVWRKRSEHEWHFNDDLFKKVKDITGTRPIEYSERPVNGRCYDKVPFEEKELAKKFGAKFDWENKLWYFRTDKERNRFREYLKENM